LSEYTALAKELGEKKSQLVCFDFYSNHYSYELKYSNLIQMLKIFQTSANTEILEYKNMLSPRGVIEYFEKFVDLLISKWDQKTSINSILLRRNCKCLKKFSILD
jgi:hypothetical protein